MRNKTVRNFFTTAALLAAVLSATTASANWYVNQPEAYYVPQDYKDKRFGDFPPTDIDQKLFGHLNTEAAAEEKKPPTASAPTATYNNPSAQAGNQQRPNPVQNYQRPAYGNYNQGRNYAPPGNQRYNRNTNFSGPWNNNQSSFSGPWNNNGSSFSGPWNNNGSSFSEPWNNNGSSFSMPWGNNNGSRSGFNPMGNGSSWSW